MWKNRSAPPMQACKKTVPIYGGVVALSVGGMVKGLMLVMPGPRKKWDSPANRDWMVN